MRRIWSPHTVSFCVLMCVHFQWWMMVWSQNICDLEPSQRMHHISHWCTGVFCEQCGYIAFQACLFLPFQLNYYTRIISGIVSLSTKELNCFFAVRQVFEVACARRLCKQPAKNNSPRLHCWSEGVGACNLRGKQGREKEGGRERRRKGGREGGKNWMEGWMNEG